jgi:hypothetical protein
MLRGKLLKRDKADKISTITIRGVAGLRPRNDGFQCNRIRA